MKNPQITDLCRDWPGKSRPEEHPALWHMMDVGAVAQHLVTLRPIANPEADQALALLASLHDIGKISESFRGMLREGRCQPWRHWQHSAVILRTYDDLLGGRLGGSDTVRKIFYEAVAGHHGGPRERETAPYAEQQKREIGEQAFAAAKLAISTIVGLFPDASLENIDEPKAKSLSWLLNGLVVQSDWIGSNADWFETADPDITVSDYWQQARQNAKKAVSQTGLYAACPSQLSIGDILPHGASPHPMQAAVQSCELPDGPSLVLIEDTTGAGKTEASLILASRMMRAGKADGLFFALPTMATANAMLSRVEAAAHKLFEGSPTLGLAHGRAHLSQEFRKIVGRDGSNREDGPHCGRWLSDDRRRVLLSDIGVGTIDQALFSVLPTRFNGLRLRALSRKVLIVDEAHSYDPYMDAQLERLLTFQAWLGGSAVVMTATLPTQKREKLIKAFQDGITKTRPSRGTRRHKPVATQPELPPYPALTVVGREASVAAVDPAPPTVRQTGIRRLSEASAAVDLLVSASKNGAACVWIRNAVDDAINAVKLLGEAGVQADLLHARFAVCDRLHKEHLLQKRFGHSGDGREGRVLVATQVAEQSLDLDFDVMVSDLAPIGSMIQRAGRLWRHTDIRPAASRPVESPVLHILSPDPNDVKDERWLHSTLEHGAYVYPPAVMWRSAAAIFKAGELRAPDGLRDLIEAVEGVEAEGDDKPSVPPALESKDFEHEGKSIVERQLARGCLIEVNKPFDQDKMRKAWDDEKFPTRLGVPQTTLALARQKGEKLEPYAGAGADGWAMSELQVSMPRFDHLSAPDQEVPEIAAVKEDWSESRKKHTIIAPLGEDGRICAGLRYDAELGAVWE